MAEYRDDIATIKANGGVIYQPSPEDVAAREALESDLLASREANEHAQKRLATLETKAREAVKKAREEGLREAGEKEKEVKALRDRGIA